MLSIQKKFLFIHVPKTGGNSIQNNLKYYSEDEIICTSPHQDGVERFGLQNKKFGITKHSRLNEYKAVIDPVIYHSLFKFAVLRNPWDMLISYYFSPHRGHVKWSREEFIILLETVPTWGHFIFEEPGQNQDWSKLNLDQLMRFENLDDDFRIVSKKIGIPYSPLPHRNRSDRKGYSDYLDQELQLAIATKFQNEIEFGDYRF